MSHQIQLRFVLRFQQWRDNAHDKYVEINGIQFEIDGISSDC